MSRKLWALLAPFHKEFSKYITGVVVRQALLVAGGYSLVWLLRAATAHSEIPPWVFIAGLVLYDIGLLRLDLGLNTQFAKRVSYPMFGHLRSLALRKVFEMPLEWHHRQDSGVLVGKVNNGVGKVVQTAESLSRDLAPALIHTGLSLIPLLYFSRLTTPFLLIALAVFLWLTILENQSRRPFRKSRYQNYARDFGMFSECVQYMQPLVQFGQTGRMMRRYRKMQRAIIEQGVAEVAVGNRYAWKRNTLLSVTKRACQGIWIWQYRSGALDVAMVMYLNMLTEELLNSFWNYAGLLERVYDSAEAARIFVNLLSETPSISDTAWARAFPLPEQVGVEMVGVNFSYTQGSTVLRRFNLQVEPGSVVGIVGRSGSGKTTIHHLLSRMFEPQEGRILVSGTDIRSWPLKQLRGLFSTVSQNGGVFFTNVSVADAIRFARPEATFREVVQAAKCACIHEDIARMPKKYQTRIGQRGVTLSKGQQQRLALAQALVAFDERRKVLILDEFTSALDSETEGRILANLAPWIAGKTVIIIAHRLSTLRKVADRIVVLDRTGVVEDGPHAELIRQNGWYAEMAKLQAIA
jgi:ABC-type multidrug transport system fused ATPase/permease subunit